MSKEAQNNEVAEVQSNLPYTHCLNCGTELKGMFCHECGQGAVSKTPSVGAFVLEYFSNAFIWDPKFLSTLWGLIRRPGHLTKEYNAGKFLSQEHPLKLNMFLLFVFATLFVLFSSTDRVTNSVNDLVEDEYIQTTWHFDNLKEDAEFMAKLEASPRDTIVVEVPTLLAKEFPGFLSNADAMEAHSKETTERWRAVVPRLLIEEQILVEDEEGCYCINKAEASASASEVTEMTKTVWNKMVSITAEYFPMLLLLTVPFLSFSIRVGQRRSKIPGINHFIFALHYTAFLEFLMIVIFLLHLTIAPPINVMEWFVIISTCSYLTVAFHTVYPSTWVKSLVKALLTSTIYTTILLLIFIAICIVACFVTAIELALSQP